MCEFCSKHGEGKIWYKNAMNYSKDLVSDLTRRKYIEQFLESTINDGFKTLGRLESMYRKKGHLRPSVTNSLINKAKREHFGQVLPLEEIRDIVLKAATIVRMPCPCRWTAIKKEVRCCYAVSYTPEAWYEGIDMSYFGKVSCRPLESVSPDNAMKQMKEMEKDGAIHTIWTMMTPFIGSICNCNVQDCLAMQTLSKINTEIMLRAEYFAFVNSTLCTGCGKCVDICQFNAFSTVTIEGKCVVRINKQKCFGCGLCRTKCSNSAISLHLR
ncbi:MAG: 4Fe-4S binding protein [bacterium]